MGQDLDHEIDLSVAPIATPAPAQMHSDQLELGHNVSTYHIDREM